MIGMCPPLGVGFISADPAAGAGKDTDSVVILALLARAQAAGESRTDIDLLTTRATRFVRKPRHAIHVAPECPWA